MKIKYDELESNIQDKLNKLDAITGKTGFVYSENGVITTKVKTDETMKQIYTSDDIVNLKKHLYKTEDNYVSGFDRLLLLTNTARSTDKLLNTTGTMNIFKSQYKYVKHFKSNNYIYLLNAFGYLYCVNTLTNETETIKLFDMLKNKFIFKPLHVSNIMSVTYYEYSNNSMVIVSTDVYGTYVIKNNNCEMLTRESNIDIIRPLSNGSILCAKTSTLQNNLFIINNTGRLIIQYNQLAKEHNYILDAFVGNGVFYVIADSKSALHSEAVVHKFKADLKDISYDYIKPTYKNKRDGNYLFKDYAIDNKNNVYILTSYHDNVVVWKYNDEFNGFEYYELMQNVQYDELKGFAVNQNIVIVTDNTYYLFNKDDMIKNIYIQNKYSDVVIINNSIYVLSELELNRVLDIDVKDYSILTINLSHLRNVNNIDVYIEANDKLKYTFYDKATNNEIKPVYGVYLNSTNAIFKIVNNTCELYLQITGLKETSVINGIVTHSNNIYYKM